MISHDPLDQFFLELETSFQQNSFLRLTVSKPRKSNFDVRSIHIRPVVIKESEMLQWVFRAQKNDVTKNLDFISSLVELKNILPQFFLSATASFKDKEAYLLLSKKGKAHLTWKSVKAPLIATSGGHDKPKTYLIHPEEPFLHLLGITSSQGKVLSGNEKKFRQINKYIEIISKILPQKNQSVKIADMGCGKGYLTFALYHWMDQQGYKDLQIVGFDLKEDVIQQINQYSKELDFNGLSFEVSKIEDISNRSFNIVIALHACDTATDDAILFGLANEAQLIVLAPCCQKQVRKSIKPDAPFSTLMKDGIMKERIASDLTDQIRANVLRFKGYRTDIIEFVGIEHTPKNLMITANYTNHHQDHALKEINTWMENFGIQNHYLLDRLELTT